MWRRLIRTRRSVILPARIGAEVVLLVASASLGGCGPEDERVPSQSRQDSAGVELVIHYLIDGEASIWDVQATPYAVIGTADGDSSVLFRVVGAVILDNGSVAIANGGTQELKLFGNNGDLMRTVGGRGQGPGEFERLSGFGRYRGDSLWVYDDGLRRLSLFDNVGTFGRSRTVQLFKGSVAWQTAAGAFGDGSMAFYALVTDDPAGQVQHGLYRVTNQVYRSPLHDDSLALLGRFLGDEGFMVQAPQGFTATIGLSPFGRTTKYAARGRHLYVFSNDSYKMDVVDRDSGLVRSVRWERPLQSVSPTDERTNRERWITAYGNEDDHEVRRAISPQLTYPPVMPAYDHVIITAEGGIWIEDYRWPPTAASMWTVFDDLGTVVARVRVPGGVVLDVSGNRVATLTLDSLDVERVSVHLLSR